jgi:murein DD-endopeptidase MepM/ murein hydrolase activator NlpD
VATADGRVTFVGRSGSFGKLIVLQHGERFETKYAHLNGYAKGIKEGTQVRQNDVIGYVGATGSATGPHLHYELLMDGTHRNSQTIFDQLPRAQSIAEAEMPRFREQTGVFVALLASKGVPTANLAQNTVASNRQE